MRVRPKFFTGLKPKQTMPDEQTQPEEVRLDLDTPAVVVEPTTEEVVHAVSEPETTEKKTDDAPVGEEDRSAYNCPACGGEGLQDEATVCPQCQGTGKV